MRNRIIQVRHYSRKMMIMMLTGAICCSSCFCETAFAKTSKVRVYDVEKGTTGFTSFTYSDNKKDESLAPSEGTEAISSASQKVIIFHQADGSTIIRKADSNGKVTLPAIKNETGYTFLGWSTKPDQTQNPQLCITGNRSRIFRSIIWQLSCRSIPELFLWEIPERILCRKLFFRNMERMQLQKYHLCVRQGRD